MGTLEIVVGAASIILSLIMIVLVTSQDAKQSDLSSIQGGGSRTSGGMKGRGQSKDVLLSKITKIIAAVFFAVILAGAIITNF